MIVSTTVLVSDVIATEGKTTLPARALVMLVADEPPEFAALALVEREVVDVVVPVVPVCPDGFAPVVLVVSSTDATGITVF